MIARVDCSGVGPVFDCCRLARAFAAMNDVEDGLAQVHGVLQRLKGVLVPYAMP
jgi:hypothetical protein